MYHLRISLDGLPQLQSGSFGSRWARRDHDKRWKELVGWATVGKRPKPPLERVMVVCTRLSASNEPPDDDNLRASFKPLIDALVGKKNDPTDPTRIFVDDSPKHMTAQYHWENCPRGKGRVVIEVTEAGEE